jgi:hypothetical protein
LITQQCKPVSESDKKWLREEGALKEIGKAKLLVAIDCCAEVSQIASIALTRQALLKACQQVLTQGVYWQGVEAIMNLVAKAPRFPEALSWLKDQVLNGRRTEALQAIAKYYPNDRDTLPWLKQAFQTDEQKGVRRMVALVIDRLYPNDFDEQMRKWL